jgi:hypothetical protein
VSFIDIAGQSLDFELLFTDSGANTATDHSLKKFLFLLLTNFPGGTPQRQKDILSTIDDTIQYLKISLSQYFENAWAVELGIGLGRSW